MRGVLPTLTDAEYEAKLMELLEGVNQDWGRGDVAEFLIAKRIKNGDLAAWLRGFGDRLLEGDHSWHRPYRCGGIGDFRGIGD